MTRATIHDLVDTDLEILELLAADGRRPSAAIGDEIGLSGPAVSDRVTRMREGGVIRWFTVGVGRSTLPGDVPVLAEAGVAPDAAGAVRDSLAAVEAVEHVFTADNSTLTAFARPPEDGVRDWVAERFADDATASVGVTLVDDVRWTSSVGGGEFALDCAECGNTDTSEGTSARLGGDVYHFCCPSCESQFTDRFERMAEEA